jgi:hypothetical protein
MNLFIPSWRNRLRVGFLAGGHVVFLNYDNHGQPIPPGPPIPTNERITDVGDIRITDVGDIRIWTP